MNDRVALVIVDGGRLLVVRREKEGRHYAVLPGGGVEPGEMLEEACLREAREETGLVVVLGEKLCTLTNRGRTEHYYRVAEFAGELALGGPELDRRSEANRYDLEWVEADRLEEVALVPEEIRGVCRACLEPGGAA